MINKKMLNLDMAVEGIHDGATILVSGFGDAGVPRALIDAVVRQGKRRLTIVSNNAGSGSGGLAALLATGRVSKIVCSYPRSAGSSVIEELYLKKEIELELVPQGTLAERIRAGGAGIGAFYTPTGVGTELAIGKETRLLNGKEQVLEYSLRGNVALVRADIADEWGNLVYRKAARNFGPIMCTAADLVVVEVRRVVEKGCLDPEVVVTPGVYVDRIVEVHQAPEINGEQEKSAALISG